MVDCDLVQGWDVLLLHLTNGEGLDLGELPVVSEAEDGCPVFGRCFVNGVYAVHERELTRQVAFGAEV